MRSLSKPLTRVIVALALVALFIGANVFEVTANNATIPRNVLNINKTLLFNRVNATVNSAINTQPSLQGALATASGKLGSARAAKNATKNLARSYWLLNRTIAYNPTNRTQLTALAEYTYGRLQFESLLKQGYAFTAKSAVPSGGSGVVAAASNMTCFFDPSTGTVTNLQQSSKLACTAGGQRVVIPTAGKYVTKVEMAVDKELPLVGRFVFHVRDTLDSKPRVHTCGFAGGEAISLFPPGYIATSIDVGCIPLTPQAIGKKRKLLAQVAKNAANPELVTAVVVSESIVREQSPDKPVSAAVVATGVVQGSTFAVSPSSLSPAVENQIENANNQTATCPSETPDICSAVGGGNICVSLATDRNRCGSCSNVCPAAQSCVSGVCSCPSATPDFCGSACVNFASDSANCGACGNVCGVSTVCQSGQCRCPVIGVVIDEQQTTSSTIVATVACAGAPASELSFKCVVQGSPKESPGLGTVSFNGVTATVSGLGPCVPYDCYAVRASPGGDVYSPAAPAVTIDNIAFSVANGFTTTNQPGPSVCGIVYPYPQGSIKGQGPGSKWSVGAGYASPVCTQAKPFDEQITVVSGEQVWRLSDAVQTTAFGNCPFMQRVKVAGETGATTGGVVVGPAQTKRTCSAFTFKSATGASQPGLYLEANTAPAYNSLRQNFLSIKTGATGFELTTYTNLLLTDGVTKLRTDDQVIATVSFADWHRVVTTVEFVDGINQGPCPAPYGSLQCYLGNDVVSIFVDGALAWQGSTFESRYYPTKQAIDSFYICPRVPSGTPVGNPASLGKGLYFKNYGIGI